MNDGAPSTDLITSAALMRVRTCTAGSVPVGVFGHDFPRGSVCTILGGGVIPITAGERITAGTLLSSDSRGQVVAATPTDFDGRADATFVVGIALDSVESGDDCPVKT